MGSEQETDQRKISDKPFQDSGLSGEQEDSIESLLAELRSDGTHLQRLPPTDIKDIFYVELESKLKKMQLLIVPEIEKRNNNDEKEFLNALVKKIRSEILPRASTWSIYAKEKEMRKIIIYSPEKMLELYKISDQICTLLMELPITISFLGNDKKKE